MSAGASSPTSGSSAGGSARTWLAIRTRRGRHRPGGVRGQRGRPVFRQPRLRQSRVGTSATPCEPRRRSVSVPQERRPVLAKDTTIIGNHVGQVRFETAATGRSAASQTRQQRRRLDRLRHDCRAGRVHADLAAQLPVYVLGRDQGSGSGGRRLASCSVSLACATPPGLPRRCRGRRVTGVRPRFRNIDTQTHDRGDRDGHRRRADRHALFHRNRARSLARLGNLGEIRVRARSWPAGRDSADSPRPIARAPKRPRPAPAPTMRLALRARARPNGSSASPGRPSSSSTSPSCRSRFDGDRQARGSGSFSSASVAALRIATAWSRRPASSSISAATCRSMMAMPGAGRLLLLPHGAWRPAPRQLRERGIVQARGAEADGTELVDIAEVPLVGHHVPAPCLDDVARAHGGLVAQQPDVAGGLHDRRDLIDGTQ